MAALALIWPWVAGELLGWSDSIGLDRLVGRVLVVGGSVVLGAIALASRRLNVELRELRQWILIVGAATAALVMGAATQALVAARNR